MRIALAGLLLLALPARADAAGRLPISVDTWRLPNGLQVVFARRPAAPGVTVQVWYHAGSKDERPGIRGVAHMFEHMMFKGSARVPPEMHAQLLSRLGGSDNAFTTEDVTAYHDTVPPQYMDFAMTLEAERMQHLYLTPGTIASEREVVKEEKRRRIENSPIGRALEAIRALAYRVHPYRWTPAGVIADLDRVTVADCEAFYRTYYVPNNATLVVVGNVTREAVAAAAMRAFGGVPRGKAPPRVTVKEPPQRGYRELRGGWPSQLNVVLGAYHVPPARHPDMAPLKVLSAILSAGRSSRLHRTLVRGEKLAVAAGGFVAAQEHPGLLYIYTVGLPRQPLDRARARLLAEVERVAAEGVTPAELAKARNQLATRLLRGLETVGGLAYRLGTSTYLRGDPRAFLGDLAAIDAVTGADVKRVAARYLVRDNLSLLLLPATGGKPRPGKGEKPRPGASNGAAPRRAGGAS